MPYGPYGEWIDSTADHGTPIIGAGEIGGIVGLIYHTFTFREYEYETISDEWFLKPVVGQWIDTDDCPTGNEIFCALYNLGKKINDVSEEASFHGDILYFCKAVAHPYFIDELYDGTVEGIVSEMLARDAAFGVSQFMRDLGRFYTTAQFYFALEKVKNWDTEDALHLAEEGRMFEGLPFFEKYKYARNEADEDRPKLDSNYISSDDLIAEMQHDNLESPAESPSVPTRFYDHPHGYYDELLDELVDIMPSFQLRLRPDPRTKQMVLAADVRSVFDIAWFVLARMITNYAPPFEQEPDVEGRPREFAVVICPNCGEAFARRSNRQQFCTKEECRKAHNALRQKKYRENKKLKETL